MRKGLSKIFVILSLSAVILSTVSLTVSALTGSVSNEFTGYSSALEASELEAQTNTVKNSDGTFSVPVSDAAPQITFLVPGYGSDASTWSNDFETLADPEGKTLKLAYNHKSIVEKLRYGSDAKIYLASDTSTYEADVKNENNAIIEEGDVIEHSFVLKELPKMCTCADLASCDCILAYDVDSLASVDRIDSISNHIVVLFSPAKDTEYGSNQRIYEQLNYVIDKLVYDVKVLNGGVLPKINLISHSRGSVNIMQYALNHPWLVDSLIPIGGVLNGSRLGEHEKILNIVKMSNDVASPDYSLGVDNILDESVYGAYKEAWNSGYDELYSHIHFHAIGGYSSIDFVLDVLERDTTYPESNIEAGSLALGTYRLTNLIGSIGSYIADETVIDDILLSDVVMYAVENATSEEASAIISTVNELVAYEGFPFFGEYVIRDDCFIHLDSQLADGYQGVTQFVRKFASGENDADFNMVAQNNVGIVHNLEPGDAQIHDYVLSVIDTGADYRDSNFYTVLNSDGTYKITGRKTSVTDGILAIPSSINGITVSEIGYSAFAGTDIVSVYIPATVKVIGAQAFYRCDDLSSVTFDTSSVLEDVNDYAFAGCSNLTSMSLPETTQKIGKLTFANCGIQEISIGANVNEIGAGAFIGNPILEFEVSNASLSYTAVDGVIYSKDMRMLVAYPANKVTTVFSLPDGVDTVEAYAFAENEYINTVYLNACTTLGDCAFYNCSQLATIQGDCLISIARDTVQNTALDNSENDIVMIGGILVEYRGTDEVLQVSSCRAIAANAINANRFTKSIVIESPISFIRSRAITGCTKLETIYIMTGDNVMIEENAISNSPRLSNVYVPEILVSYYKASPGLTDYTDNVCAHTTVIHYDSNGGTAVEDGTVEYYSNIDSLPTPTRVGYNFDGWSYALDGSIFEVNVGDTWLNLVDEVTFTANWVPAEYSVILHANGGVLVSSSLTYTIEDATFALPIPTKSGYTFAGWYSSASFDGDAVQSIANGSYGNVEYYAKWQANEYTVTLDYNYTDAPDAGTVVVTYGQAFDLPSPSRVGYHFNGWRYNGTLYTGEDGASVKNWDVAGNADLLADWTREHYYIKIDVNGTYYWIDESKNISANATPIEFGTTYVSLNSLLQAFVNSEIGFREGYQTIGFNMSDANAQLTQSYLLDQNGALNDLGDDGTVLLLTPIYAAERFSIIFEASADVSSPTLPATVFAYYNQAISISDAAKAGYTFQSWRVKDCSENSKFEGTIFEIGQSFNFTSMPDLSVNTESTSATDEAYSIILEPVFAANRITIVYSAGTGVSYANGTILFNTAPGGFTFVVPTRTGYTFGGWYDGTNGTGTQYSNSGGILTRAWDKTSSTTLYAKWTPITYTITYVLNGGTNSSNNQTAYDITSATITLSDATRAGYRFMGWYSNSSFTTRVTTISKGSTGNKTLYAKWSQLYTVSFEHLNIPTVLEGVMGETITTPALDVACIYVSGSTRVLGNQPYTITGNIEFVSEEKTIYECYNSQTGYYEIYRYSQLRAISEIATNSSNKYRLMCDIQMNVTYTKHITAFHGTLDGDGHTLKYVRALVPNFKTETGTYGLVTENYGTIKNINISGVIIDIREADTTTTNWIYAGFVAGVNYGTIKDISLADCEVIGNRSTTSLGGITGLNNGGTISNCDVSNITFTGYGDMGGIVGSTNGGIVTQCSATSLTFIAKIDGANRSVGGIVGHAYNGANISYCTSMNVSLTFDSYTNLDISEVQPCIGTVVGSLHDSVLLTVGASGCTLSYGTLPERTGNIFNWHYPREYIGGYAYQMVGFAANSTMQ